ncbi:MAG TPA: hypothetical protein VLW26_08370 [Steroidobacteraceae bacterium]|nr:hypothetical protein [Steroidobacteraceae bacterium]
MTPTRAVLLIATVCVGVAGCLAPGLATAAGAYQHFVATVYIPVGATRQLADAATLERQYARISSQLRFDKVYLEVYREGQFADEASLAPIKRFFAAHGIAVSGGITLAAAGRGGQFGTFDYENPQDRAECQRAVEMAARNFDQVILDDFFFYTTKSDADIAAKGKRSWTQYRLERMREVAQTLVLKPARAANPKVQMIIKYPNWYEHFQGLGYDLDQEARQFDAIYTGTETRDPETTDQLLQQYESYLIVRYFDNIRPGGGNHGGWVDTYDTRYVDRYAEQLWLTLFARAPEITLFNWADLARADAVGPGERSAWSSLKTSFNWDAMEHGGPAAPAGGTIGWARVAGYSLEQADRALPYLGKPTGIASYKPYQSLGEDYLQNYLGNAGVPIELMPQFPANAATVLLTEQARFDPAIVSKIKSQLTAGRNVVITSGLLQALQGKGIEDIVELQYTGRKIAVHEFLEGYGAGRGTSLNDPAVTQRDILFPEIRFLTNDSWVLVRGVANAQGLPILLMNRYSRGVIYVLNIPENIGDLYALPQAVWHVLRTYLQGNFPVRIDAPVRVSLFAYDNGSLIVHSFRSEPTSVRLELTGTHGKLTDPLSGESFAADQSDAVALRARTAAQRRNPDELARTSFIVPLAPHSFRVLKPE